MNKGEPPADAAPKTGWHTPPGQASLSEVNRSVPVPGAKAPFWRQWMAFSGPAILISVGYMDPGNWGTDLAGGAQYHLRSLAQLTGARLLLLHVADGWVARNFNQLKLAESEEMKDDRTYLEKVAVEMRAEGFAVTTELALGNPPQEIVKVAEGAACDLIAMAGHGHRLFDDLFHGSTITEVRHKTAIPLLVVRGPKK